jgi:hypothetical protein
MITIQAQLAKKVPVPGVHYASQQASITITAEITDLGQVTSEAQRLYALAEQAVDTQLAASASSPSPAAPAAPAAPSAHGSTATASRPAPPARGPGPAIPPGSASRPYRAPAPRGPAPVTDSQLRFLRRLIDERGLSLPAILEQHQVGSLADLSCKAAAGLIDELKQQPVPT